MLCWEELRTTSDDNFAKMLAEAKDFLKAGVKIRPRFAVFVQCIKQQNCVCGVLNLLQLSRGALTDFQEDDFVVLLQKAIQSSQLKHNEQRRLSHAGVRENHCVGEPRIAAQKAIHHRKNSLATYEASGILCLV